ncbi:MarR family winged helix-turn-helix transcriptional regulator [Streptomyces sp. NPDC059477]|uniref:MarR family winged helix-turn-helix transcriptional regulator n=1 Tax=Streptomyces sp. NPDC059477 TaxID=3346847 RepID=UPI0036AEE978
MSEPRWLTPREAEIWAMYRRLGRGLQRAQDQQLQRDSGISAADYALLAPLSESEDGVLRARELGAWVDWERSRLSHQISRMEKRGLVVREACADDARGSMVRLTAKGRETVEGAAPGHVDIVRQLFFGPLDADETKTLGDLLGRIVAAVEGDTEGGA